MGQDGGAIEGLDEFYRGNKGRLFVCEEHQQRQKQLDKRLKCYLMGHI